MENILENSIIAALQRYIETEGLRQNMLANRLGWSPQDLSDTLQRRKPIGKNRQVHIKKTLGKTYEQLLLKELAKHLQREISGFEELFGSISGKMVFTESLAEYVVHEEIAEEGEYTDKLMNIFRKKDDETVIVLKQIIDTFLRMPDDPHKQ